MVHTSSVPRARVGAVAARIDSIDALRGLVVVLMAIDHVRVYSGIPAGGPTLGIFFTRWITHFVAPTFVFLAGTAAFLHGRKLEDRGQLAKFLLTRGLWLVLLEFTVIRLGWTFNLDFAHYMLAGVIWVIGCSMMILAGVVYLPVLAVAALGLVIIVGHNIMDIVARPHLDAIRESSFNWVWSLAYFAFEVGGSEPLVVLYSLVPWAGVMAAGYAFGSIFVLDSAARRQMCIRLGAGAVLMFVVLRALNAYGDPRHWQVGQTWTATLLSFLNTSKYPASLLFLLMTLGPALLALAWFERANNGFVRVLQVFGRVPMFYYLLHIPLIHVLALGVSLVREGSISPWLFENHPMGNGPAPPGYLWNLWLLYVVTALAVGMLYPACRWFGQVKRNSRSRWLSYV